LGALAALVHVGHQSRLQLTLTLGIIYFTVGRLCLQLFYYLIVEILFHVEQNIFVLQVTWRLVSFVELAIGEVGVDDHV